MAAWTPSSRTLVGVLVVALFLGAIGAVWVSSTGDNAADGPDIQDAPRTPSSQLGGGTVGQGGPLPESPVLAFDRPKSDGIASVAGREFDSLARAVSHADAGDVVRARGRFRESVRVETPGVTIESPSGTWGVIDGSGPKPALDVRAPNVTLSGLWVNDAAATHARPDPAVYARAPNLTIEGTRLTNVSFGIRGERAHHLQVDNVTVVGRADAADGIRLWRTDDPIVSDSRFTDLRDAIRYEWVTNGRIAGNTVWDVRYSLSVLQSTELRIRDNRYFNNDVGVVLLHSRSLEISDNWIVNNTGRSGHGILLNSIEDSQFRNNTILSNEDGLFVDNAVGNRIVENNVSHNGHGVVFDAEQNELARNVIAHNRFGVIVVRPVADSVLERVSQQNSFHDNGRPIFRTDW